MNSHTSKERAEAKHTFKNTLAQSTSFFHRRHPIVFNNLQGKQTVYSCCQKQ
jgi:hypothetical protein